MMNFFYHLRSVIVKRWHFICVSFSKSRKVKKKSIQVRAKERKEYLNFSKWNDLIKQNKKTIPFTDCKPAHNLNQLNTKVTWNNKTKYLRLWRDYRLQDSISFWQRFKTLSYRNITFYHQLCQRLIRPRIMPNLQQGSALLHQLRSVFV